MVRTKVEHELAEPGLLSPMRGPLGPQLDTSLITSTVRKRKSELRVCTLVRRAREQGVPVGAALCAQHTARPAKPKPPRPPGLPSKVQLCCCCVQRSRPLMRTMTASGAGWTQRSRCGA